MSTRMCQARSRGAVVSTRMSGGVQGRRGEHSHARRGVPIRFEARGVCLEVTAHSILIDGGDGRATSGECDGETVLGALALHGAQEHAPSREPRSCHLMREAISLMREAITPSREPRSCHLRREAIRGSSNQTQSDAIRPNQTHSDPIRRNQTQSDPIRPNQTQSHLRALFTPHYA